MANFQNILEQVSTAAQIVEAAEPAIEAFGADHVAGTQQLLQIAGAGVAAETNDKTVQAEAIAASQVASVFVPLVFRLFSLFGHKKTPTITAAPAAPAS